MSKRTITVGILLPVPLVETILERSCFLRMVSCPFRADGELQDSVSSHPMGETRVEPTNQPGWSTSGYVGLG